MRKATFLALIWAVGLLCAAALHAQDFKTLERRDGLVFVDALELGLTGKMMPTSNPYWRVDTVKYKGFVKGENLQVRCPAGMSVAFTTDATDIWVDVRFGDKAGDWASTAGLALSGFDLYIKDAAGEWIWAGKAGYGMKDKGGVMQLVRSMDGSQHDCLLYLPIYSEIYSLKIGVNDGAGLSRMSEPPFRHRVVVFGSSYTHGISTSRAGMAYPSQFTRHTGVQMISLGCSGNCKLQSYFADVLCDVEADAFVFDAFSNPPASMIEERLFPFIERVRAAHPGVPLIFQQTIYREGRNFNKDTDAFEQAKMDMADSLMKIAVKKYPDVYFIRPNASVKSHESTVDGVHPDDYGYWLWSRSIEKPVLRILRRYGIR